MRYQFVTRYPIISHQLSIYNRSLNILRLLEEKKRKKKEEEKEDVQFLDYLRSIVRSCATGCKDDYDVSIITIIIIYEQVISFSPSNRRFFDILIFNILIFFLIIISRKIRRGELNDVYPSIRVQQDVRTIIIRLLLLLFMNKS